MVVLHPHDPFQVYGDVKSYGNQTSNCKYHSGYFRISYNTQKKSVACELFYDVNNARVSKFELSKKNLASLPASVEQIEKNESFTINTNEYTLFIKRTAKTKFEDIKKLYLLLKEVKGEKTEIGSSHIKNTIRQRRPSDQSILKTETMPKSESTQMSQFVNGPPRICESPTIGKENIFKKCAKSTSSPQRNALQDGSQKGNLLAGSACIESTKPFHEPPKATAKFYGKAAETASSSRHPLKILNSNSVAAAIANDEAFEHSPCKKIKLSDDAEGNNEVSEVSEKTPESINNASLKCIGFSNIGNSCYMNSVIQAIMGLDCFVGDLRSTFALIEKFPKSSLVRSLLALEVCRKKEDHYKKHCENLLKTVKASVCEMAPWFSGHDQHDAHEFLGQVFDQMKDELQKSNAEGCEGKRPITNPISKNFEYELLNSYACKGCGETIAKKDLCYMISVEIPKTERSTVQDAIDNYFESQDVDYVCEKCNHKKANYDSKFSKLPRVVIVHLQRYCYSQQSMKILDAIHIPTKINLEKFVIDEPDKPKPFENQDLLSSEELETYEFETLTEEPVLQSELPDVGNCVEIENSSHTTVENRPAGYESPEHTFKCPDPPFKTPEPIKEEAMEVTENTKSGPIALCESPKSSKSSEGLENVPIGVLVRNRKSPKALKFSQNGPHYRSRQTTLIGLNGGLSDIPYTKDMQGPKEDVMLELPDEAIPSSKAKSEDQHEEWDHLQEALELSIKDLENQETLNLQQALKESIEAPSPEDEPLPENVTEPEITEKEDEDDEESPFVYRLESIVSHVGNSALAGHYLCDVYDFVKRQWVHCNDETVFCRTEEKVLRENQHTGYLLFYVARDFCSFQNC